MSYPRARLNQTPRHSPYAPENDKKRMPSCDLCRLRKMKCVKTAGEKCEGCIALEQDCEYIHIRKKPGPPNKFARQKKPDLSLTPHPQTSHTSTPHPSYPLRLSTDSQSWMSNHAIQYPLSTPPITFNHSHILADQASDRAELPYLPLAPSVLTDHSHVISQASGWRWDTVETGWDALDLSTDQRLKQVPHGMIHGHRAPYPRAIMWSSPEDQLAPLEDARQTLDDSRKSSKAGQCPRPLYRLEDEIEWSIMMRILRAYHSHLYPLMPIVHWPTFSQQLINRADEQSESWRAFLFALVAYSSIQLPRSNLSFLPVEQLKPLHQRCFQASQKLQNRKYKEVKLVDIKTLYCQHVYLGSLGDQGASVIALSKSVSLSFMLDLHDESRLPEGTNPIDREVRRRVFWLIYHISAGWIPLQFPAVPPPWIRPISLEISHGKWKNPVIDPHRTLTLPQGREWIRPSIQFHEELERLLDELPGPLQLSTHGASVLHAEVDLPETDQAAFAGCRANLLITQAMTRFAIRKYAKAIGDQETEGDCKDWAEKDVLGLLERMSPESLAANGNAMRVKLLFVTSALMEKHPVNTVGHNYVTDFLNVYTRAAEEQSLAMLEVGSLVGSRESSPEFGYAARVHESYERSTTGKDAK